jgi:hypothetical protein
MHPLTEIKEKQKVLASKIRELKNSRKGKTVDELASVQFDIWRSKRDYRHTHIAYSLVRGRAYGQIENPRENNKPNWDIVNRLKDALQKKVDAARVEWEINNPPKAVANG